MKTNPKEILRREYEYKNHRRKLDFLERKNKELLELEKEGDLDAAAKRQSLLESKEWEKERDMESFGPTYDLPIEDIEDPNFRFPFGGKPLDQKFIIEEYNGIGSRVKLRHSDEYGLFECLSYDYGDFYYKILLDTGKTLYETGCAGIIKYTFINNQSTEGKVIEHISELSDIIILYFADQTWTSFSLIKKE